jgi:pimeloyl-ACP methyl ester carboxylesterase
VGHDWGGGVAWGLAGVAPARIQTLTALSTPHPAALASALADETSCQYGASAYFEVLGAPDSTVEDLAAIGAGLEGVPEASVKEYLERIMTNPEAMDAALNWYRANLKGRVLTGTVGAIEVPTLYLWGTDDVTFCGQTAEASADHVTAPYRFVAVEGGGHWLPEANAELVNTELLSHLRR